MRSEPRTQRSGVSGCPCNRLLRCAACAARSAVIRLAKPVHSGYTSNREAQFDAKGVAVAAFKQHVTFSSLLGVGYAASLAGSGFEWVHSVLAGGLCGIAGMLPDLDSPSGRPVRELFGITAIAVPLLLTYRLRRSGLEPEQLVLFAAVGYLLIRFGLSWVFKHLTVHRGMFHSIPAMLIAGEAVYLAHDCPEQFGRLTLAGGIMLGFLSHLVLDEIYAVDMNGVAPRSTRRPAAPSNSSRKAGRPLSAPGCCWVG